MERCGKRTDKCRGWKWNKEVIGKINKGMKVLKGRKKM
jgi:hypothetical protein